MNRILGLLACLALLAAPAVMAQGKPQGASQGKPPSSAPQQGPDRQQDRDREQADDGKGQGNPNEVQQELQKRCQDRAHERGLKGDEHGRFMQECMGNVPDSKGQGGKPEQTPRR